MSTSQFHLAAHQHVTPPSSFAEPPLTPPPTDEKPFPQARRVIALFKAIRAGRHSKQHPWSEFHLAAEEYDEIERQLGRDEELSGYVKDKIRYDYSGESRRLVVRMPTGVHELFVEGVEDGIRSQLKSIRCGPDRAARFAQRVRVARSTEIHFPIEDALEYPGVIIEVAYSQKRKRLARLAEDYLLDSDANVRAVVGLDIEYKKKGSRKATLSVWRTHLFNTPDGDELRVIQEVADETFRNDDGSPSDHPGLRLRLSDFAFEELAHNELGDEGKELVITAQQFCEYLSVAEAKAQQVGSCGKHSIAPGVKKRKRLETPEEKITSGDEARYTEQEERAAKRVADKDSDYEEV